MSGKSFGESVLSTDLASADEELPCLTQSRLSQHPRVVAYVNDGDYNIYVFFHCTPSGFIC
jgi:hypothetical protein